MQMTEDEIVTNVWQAKDQKGQIKICAELNAVPAETIKKILREHGVDLRSLKGSSDGRRRNGKSKAMKPDMPETAANQYDLDDSINCVAARIRELVVIRDKANDELAAIYNKLSRLEDTIAGRSDEDDRQAAEVSH